MLAVSEFSVPFTLDQLRIVRAIAECGSFRKAADRLFISQPAVSLQVQNLERLLAATLFDRGGRKVVPTEVGRLLVEYSCRILDLSEEACRAVADVKSLQRGSLALGASQTVGTYMMPYLIGEFRLANPQITVRLQVQSTRRIAHDVVDGSLDLAIVGGDIPDELRQSLEIQTYAQDEFVLVTAPVDSVQFQTSVLQKVNRVLQAEDLYALPLITLNPQSNTRRVIDTALVGHGINPSRFRVEMELNSLEAIKNSVYAGLGVAFLSLTAVGADLARGALVHLPIQDLQVKRQLLLIHCPERYQSQAAQRFRAQLMQVGES